MLKIDLTAPAARVKLLLSDAQPPLSMHLDTVISQLKANHRPGGAAFTINAEDKHDRWAIIDAQVHICILQAKSRGAILERAAMFH
ncbi:hypothetical protein NJB1907f44_44230 [Mycobacterium marinum]|nr:hypothetical protein NJB1907f34b_02160 [Mycobacterium marinum]GJO11383.1 hypothetical protein NJB1907E90_31580 [Mycobacterium marinum]GJO16983.1 hypothetical protein NJB1907E11_18800 [Mycobacterium marinum]GJO19487.1 hypothetical protein NJB1728e18_17680 [Mycobacterium marinum]GJO31756.1 hypothetical protein NJB1907f22_30910 [Mycobacterium marinum]